MTSKMEDKPRERATGLKWKVAQWAELRWWKNYLQGKNKKEYYEWKSNYWNDLLTRIKPHFQVPENKLLVDAGCGPAGIFIVLNETKNKTVAFDPLLDNYQDKLAFFEIEEYSNTRFENCGIENFELKEKADVIFCMNAINHVSDIHLSYRNLIQQLKPGGTIVVTIDAHNHSFFKHTFRKLPGDILHPHQYDLKEYEDFLTGNGCQIVHEERIKKEFFFDHYLTVAKKH